MKPRWRFRLLIIAAVAGLCAWGASQTIRYIPVTIETAVEAEQGAQGNSLKVQYRISRFGGRIWSRRRVLWQTTTDCDRHPTCQSIYSWTTRGDLYFVWLTEEHYNPICIPEHTRSGVGYAIHFALVHLGRVTHQVVSSASVHTDMDMPMRQRDTGVAYHSLRATKTDDGSIIISVTEKDVMLYGGVGPEIETSTTWTSRDNGETWTRKSTVVHRG